LHGSLAADGNRRGVAKFRDVRFCHALRVTDVTDPGSTGPRVCDSQRVANPDRLEESTAFSGSIRCSQAACGIPPLRVTDPRSAGPRVCDSQHVAISRNYGGTSSAITREASNTNRRNPMAQRTFSGSIRNSQAACGIPPLRVTDGLLLIC